MDIIQIAPLIVSSGSFIISYLLYRDKRGEIEAKEIDALLDDVSRIKEDIHALNVKHEVLNRRLEDELVHIMKALEKIEDLL